MLKEGKSKLIGLSFLFLSVLIFAYALLIDKDNVVVYALILVCLILAIMFNNQFELISPAVLFTAYYIYSVGVGPIILMNMGRFYSYGYTKIVLGGLLAFACANAIFLFLIKGNITERKDGSKVVFLFSRIKALYLLLIISWFASAFYFIKNRSFLLGNIEDGRVSAMSGNGAILHIAQLSIPLVCMLFDIYIETQKSGRPIISKYKLVFVTFFSALTLIVTGFRAPVATLFICMIIIYAGKKKMSMWKIFACGLLCIIGVVILAVIRTSMSGGTGNALTSFLTSLYVGNINIEYMYSTFPQKVGFQYGYTYLINFIMLLPGPDLDFTLWLKEQVGIVFSGGGLTPTILGEFYINFGEFAIFIGMFLMGGISVYLNRYFKQHKASFLAAFYVWQFAHCVSGGIANVSVTILLYTIVYKCLLMLPYGTTRRLASERR